MTDATAQPISQALSRGEAAPAPFRAKTEPLGADLYRGIGAWTIWSMLGWNDIRQRYRRSVLGPFWITLSMAVLNSKIFHQELRTYLPYVALGFIVWGFINSATNESCGAFMEATSVIRQIRLPFSVFVLRVAWRNFIVLMHTIILIVPIWLIFGISPGWGAFLAFPGLALVFVNQVWLGIVIAVFSARFRDVPLVVQSLLQIGMFATPIMWPINSLGPHVLIAEINPVYHLMEIVREPLLGLQAPTLSWLVAIGLAIVGTFLAGLLVRRATHRIVYWL